jgi:hypothetical protein
MPRFILLEHTGAPDDPVGRHYDLLLEAGEACRTWRLLALPLAGGPAVAAIELPPHRLEWLDRLEGEVSGGRGHARRIAAGRYEILTASDSEPLASDAIVLELTGEALGGRIALRTAGAGWAVSLG